MNQNINNKTKYGLGDYVSTTTYKGRIYLKHKDFNHTGESIEWFNNLVIKLKKETLDEKWYSILVDGNGAIVVPESDIIEKIELPEFTNYWNDYYFSN